MKTEKLGIVEQLAEKYAVQLAKAQKELQKRGSKRKPPYPDYTASITLFSKWAYRVGKGWYGFALEDIPPVWAIIIDEFLEWLEFQHPDFIIYQIKIKASSLRMKIGTETDFLIRDEKICCAISQLQNLLRLPSFV